MKACSLQNGGCVSCCTELQPSHPASSPPMSDGSCAYCTCEGDRAAARRVAAAAGPLPACLPACCPLVSLPRRLPARCLPLHRLCCLPDLPARCQMCQLATVPLVLQRENPAACLRRAKLGSGGCCPRCAAGCLGTVSCARSSVMALTSTTCTLILHIVRPVVCDAGLSWSQPTILLTPPPVHAIRAVIAEEEKAVCASVSNGFRREQQEAPKKLPCQMTRTPGVG